ncbi:hypothetical protein AVEN_104213-1 [Araneus ventricosus]|uniref:Uncharacterized protein n=1 Tax=Araneus ventricosus TaxID=182803 RepID=A0A4Y2JU62_ARAVE|nr:hypothetical protein AVEN_104213-1 [Araneus ventricosus]
MLLLLPVALPHKRFELLPPDTVARGERVAVNPRLPITASPPSRLARALAHVRKGRSVGGEARPETPSRREHGRLESKDAGVRGEDDFSSFSVWRVSFRKKL